MKILAQRRAPSTLAASSIYLSTHRRLLTGESITSNLTCATRMVRTATMVDIPSWRKNQTHGGCFTLNVHKIHLLVEKYTPLSTEDYMNSSTGLKLHEILCHMHLHIRGFLNKERYFPEPLMPF